jgi:NTE family protein
MKLFRKKPPAKGPAPDPEAAPDEAGSSPKPISLGLQGGGSHGAFQWGVLDALLEDGRLSFSAITAASAGAMNAVVVASGFSQDGARGARAKLDAFWRGVNQAGGRNIFGDSAIWTAALNPKWLQENPFYRYYEGLMLSSSPYDFNPFNLNPLSQVLDEIVDFEAVRACPFHLFISATDVKQGRLRIFEKSEITREAVLASSALPYLFRAVEIDGEPYWDGGYLANPPLWPLFYADTPRDILILMLNPFRRKELPRTAGDIVDRMNEISFNSTLTAELRSVAFVQKLISEGLLTESARGRYRHMLIHVIEADGRLDDLPMSSKFNTEWSFLLDLKGRGRRAAHEWLKAHYDAVGVTSSVDIRAQFL